MAQVSLTTIIEAIEKGTFDAGIDRLTDAVYGRRIILKEKREQAIWDQLEVGTKIRLNNKVKPTYLRGLTGVITDFRRTRVTLRMDKPLPGRYGTGKGRLNYTLICPPALLQIVPEEKTTSALQEHLNNTLGKAIGDFINEADNGNDH